MRDKSRGRLVSICVVKTSAQLLFAVNYLKKERLLEETKIYILQKNFKRHQQNKSTTKFLGVSDRVTFISENKASIMRFLFFLLLKRFFSRSMFFVGGIRGPVQDFLHFLVPPERLLLFDDGTQSIEISVSEESYQRPSSKITSILTRFATLVTNNKLHPPTKMASIFPYLSINGFHIVENSIHPDLKILSTKEKTSCIIIGISPAAKSEHQFGYEEGVKRLAFSLRKRGYPRISYFPHYQEKITSKDNLNVDNIIDSDRAIEIFLLTQKSRSFGVASVYPTTALASVAWMGLASDVYLLRQNSDALNDKIKGFGYAEEGSVFAEFLRNTKVKLV